MHAVLAGAPEHLLATYEEECRPIAAEMLGLATRLLEAAKRGSMRRGREVHQLNLGYGRGDRARFGTRLPCGDPEPAYPIGRARRSRTVFTAKWRTHVTFTDVSACYGTAKLTVPFPISTA
jgi:hypothetical protein